MTSVALSAKTPSAERTVRLSGADLVSLLIRAPWPPPSVCTDPYIGSRPPDLIHSYDFPPLAARGLAAAERYADVAPSAPHALHMPSHVYSMLGMWQESIRSNQASLPASRTYVHAMDFMTYGVPAGRAGS